MSNAGYYLGTYNVAVRGSENQVGIAQIKPAKVGQNQRFAAQHRSKREPQLFACKSL